MTRSTTTALLGPEFDAFLFASVDKESNEGSFSVLSALARSDVDPWQEAAELARMPREAANQRLTSLIAALPGGAAASLAPATIADRLIKLLPRTPSPVGKLLQTDPTPHSGPITSMILVSLLVMAGMLFAQWAFVDLQSPHKGMPGAAASHTAVVQTSQAGQLNR